MTRQILWEGDFGPFFISEKGTLALTIYGEGTDNTMKVTPVSETELLKTSRIGKGESFSKTVEIGKAMTYNHAVMFLFENEFGMKEGIGVVVGSK